MTETLPKNPPPPTKPDKKKAPPPMTQEFILHVLSQPGKHPTSHLDAVLKKIQASKRSK